MDIRKQIRIVLENVFQENEFKIPEIPGTKNFWHGGNLDDYNDIIAQKNGRYEFGPGLYITTHYDTAKKYSKGSRKMYLVTVQNGVDIHDAFLPEAAVKNFINSYVIGSKRKEIWERLQKFKVGDTFKAYVFNNIILNEKAIKSTNTSQLRQFYVDNGIDYELVSNAFGWGETMMVLYNMKKVVQTIVMKPTDKLDKYDLHEESLIEEDYSSIKEIKDLANDVLKASAKVNLDYIHRQIKGDPESNSIRFYSVKLIDVYQENPRKYPSLQEFLINSNVNVGFGLKKGDLNVKGNYIWSRQEYDTTKQRFITLFYNEYLTEKLKDKYNQNQLNNEGDIYFTFYYEFASTLEHELQHAYDDFRSKTNIFYNKRFDKYNSKYHLPSGKEVQINDPDMQSKKHVDYLKLQHEIEARFTQAVSKTRFSSGDFAETPDGTAYIHYKMKPLADVLKSFRHDFGGWLAMTDKVKKNLYRRVSQYWHKEAEALPEKNRKSLEREKAAQSKQLAEIRKNIREVFEKNETLNEIHPSEKAFEEEIIQVAKQLNVKLDKFIGAGAHGIAYEIPGNKVLKITIHPNEVNNSKLLVKKKNEYLVNIDKVYSVKKNHHTIIIMEKLQPLGPWKKRLKDFDEAVGRYYGQFLWSKSGGNWDHDDDFGKQLPPNLVPVFHDIVNIFSEARQKGIELKDVRIDNLGLKNGHLAAFDLG